MADMPHHRPRVVGTDKYILSLGEIPVGNLFACGVEDIVSDAYSILIDLYCCKGNLFLLEVKEVDQ